MIRGARVAVIGGTGCGGRGLAHGLVAAGAEVVLLARGQTPPPVETARVRLRHVDRHAPGALAAELRDVQPDFVIDQIAYRGADVRALAEALPPAVRRVLVTSSALVYGPDRPEGPRTETEPLAPAGPFAEAKAEADRAAAGLPGAVVVRLGYLYGPGHAPLTPWGRDPGLAERLRAGRPLPVPADDQPRLQPFHAEDFGALAARLLGLERPPPVLNAAGGETLSWAETLATWAAALGCPPPKCAATGPEGLAAMAPAPLRPFLAGLHAPTRLDLAALRGLFPDARPRAFLDGARELLRGPAAGFRSSPS